MGWNPNSPTNDLRVSLLAYLRARQQRLEDATNDGSLAAASEIGALRRWIAWLDGAEVPV
jgi:hypothetical protein